MTTDGLSRRGRQRPGTRWEPRGATWADGETHGTGRRARWSRRLVVARPAALMLAMALTACDDDSGDAPIDDAAAADNAASESQPACDHLADLGDAILGVSDTATHAEVQDAVAPAVDDFVAAAGQSGDGELGELANTVDEAFRPISQPVASTLARPGTRPTSHSTGRSRGA